MAKGRLIEHVGEALVLRTWPFAEADLLVSLLTREQGVVKGVARHALRSRRRFGGALEPGTAVMAHYAERPREELVRMDRFEVVWSPLRAEASWLRTAGMQVVVEVLEQVLPEGAPEDNVFRLAVAVLQAMEPAGADGEPDVLLPVMYFCVWMCRLMGWWPELSHCAACGMDLRGGEVWWSAALDGVTCKDDRRADSQALPAQAVADAAVVLRTPVEQVQAQRWGAGRIAPLLRFATTKLERHMERRIRSVTALEPASRRAWSRR